MMKIFSLILAMLTTALLAPNALKIKAEESASSSIPSIAKLSAASVIKVWGPGSSGSGVVVKMPKEDGTGTKNVIFTAYHVVSNLGKNEYAEINHPNGEIIKVPSSSVSKVTGYDLAVLDLPENLAKSNALKSVEVGNSNALVLGQTIIIAGYPIKKSTNESDNIRIKPGVIQTFSQKDKTTSLVGYDAITVPGMSGGGVFSMDGKLMLIHLKGERDLRETDIYVEGRPLKSGTNYGIPALLALKEAQRQALSNFNTENPLDEFRKGLYLVQNNKTKDAYDVFKKLSTNYPDSLVAEWNTACMKLQLKYPNGIRKSKEYRKTQSFNDDFYNKHKMNPFYGIPFASDSTIWDRDERLTLLSFDPIYAMANPVRLRDDLRLNRGSLITLNFNKDRCEMIAGLKKHWRTGDLYWHTLSNWSKRKGY